MGGVRIGGAGGAEAGEVGTVSEPILIRCEGSGAESSYCQMCASAPSVNGVIVDHDRLDVLAMLERGDFNAPLAAP
jgi:hypothetical protein